MSESSGAFYNAKWEAKDYGDLNREIAKISLLVGGNIAATYFSGGTSIVLRALWLGGTSLGSGGKIISDLFDSAKQTGKFTGALLACSLAVGYPFYT
jgi:hypothetical protein